jgi:hypothetical protein
MTTPKRPLFYIAFFVIAAMLLGLSIALPARHKSTIDLDATIKLIDDAIAWAKDCYNVSPQIWSDRQCESRQKALEARNKKAAKEPRP